MSVDYCGFAPERSNAFFNNYSAFITDAVLLLLYTAVYSVSLSCNEKFLGKILKLKVLQLQEK